MKLLITGGSGTLGRQITKLAIANNHQVNILTRNKKLESNNVYLKYYYWNPNKEEIDSECFKGINSVINLAGYSVFNLWTKTNKSKILSSRLISTLFILKQIKERGIKLNSFISASGIAAYPDSISKTSSEKNSVSIPDSFINQVVVKWESKVLEFEKQLPDISFSILRIGLVLSKESGVFSISKRLSTLYALSPLGKGNQWQSWIHIDDASLIFLKCINNTSKGVFNLVAPNPVVQSELLRKIALYNRSAIILPNIPKFVVKLFFGQMSELVLSSQKVISNNLNDYNFKFPDIDSAIKNLSN